MPSGGSIEGNGIIQAASPVLLSGGLIAPGGVGFFGTIQITGGIIDVGGVLDTGLDNPSASSQSDLLSVSGGTCLLSGTLDISFPNGFSGANQTYTIITDSSGITGTFTTVNISGSGYSGSTYGVDVRYTGTAVYVDVATKSAAPTITSLSVSSVSSDGGQSETIGGTGFTDVQTVRLGGVPVESETVVSSTQINVVLPPEATGSPNLTVSTAAGSASSSVTVTSGTVPAISSMSITGGYLAGGEAETITGTGVLGTTAVTFGSEPALSFYVDSSTQITAYAPPVTNAGMVNVTVTDYSGTSSVVSADQYTYATQPAPSVTSLSVSSGPSMGGTSVTITGTGFENVDDILIGNVLTTDFTVSSSTSIVVTAPTVSSLSVTSGPSIGGTSVTITGLNFKNVDAILFGSVLTTNFTVSSSTSIIVTSPQNVIGTVDVIVETDGGDSAPNSGDRYTFTGSPVPVISSLSVSSGSTGGTTQVVLTGFGFSAASALDFGTVAATNWVVDADDEITAYAPTQGIGTVAVTVVTPAGTSVASATTDFTYTGATGPAVTSLTTTSGSTAGGTITTIEGSGFTAATAVYFGTVPAPSFSILSDGSIVATAPPQAAGTVDVTVVTPSGTSSTGSGDQFTYSNAATPTVTGLDVSSGPSVGGTQVTILGTGFLGATSVSFGSVLAAFQINSDSSITAWDPGQATGTYHITVTSPGGTSTTSSADEFTDNTTSLPTLTGLSTTSGTTVGGTASDADGHGV